MVIVGGTFEIESDHREQFIASRMEMMRTSRAEAGCLEYTFAADPLDTRRVVLYERWQSQAALDAHLDAMRSGPPRLADPGVISSSIVIYDVSGELPLSR